MAGMLREQTLAALGFVFAGFVIGGLTSDLVFSIFRRARRPRRRRGRAVEPWEDTIESGRRW